MHIRGIEVLLLPPQVAEHRLGIRTDVDRLQKPQARALHGIHRAQQGSLLIDALAEMRHEGAGDVEALVQHLRRYFRPYFRSKRAPKRLSRLDFQ